MKEMKRDSYYKLYMIFLQNGTKATRNEMQKQLEEKGNEQKNFKPGTEIRDRSKIMDTVEQFYKDLYSSKKAQKKTDNIKQENDES